MLLVTLLSTTGARAQEIRTRSDSDESLSASNARLLEEHFIGGKPGKETAEDPQKDDRSLEPSQAPQYAKIAWSSLENPEDPKWFLKAAGWFSKSILCDPLYTDAHRGRGVAYLALHMLPQARDYFDFVLAKEPWSKEIRSRRAYACAVAAESRDVDLIKAAQEELDRLSRETHDDAFTRGARGVIALKREDFQHAIGDLSLALEHGLDDPAIRYYRAVARGDERFSSCHLRPRAGLDTATFILHGPLLPGSLSFSVGSARPGADRIRQDSPAPVRQSGSSLRSHHIGAPGEQA